MPARCLLTILLLMLLGLAAEGMTAAPQTTVISLADADLTFLGENAADWAGYAVSPAGDVNNDGYDDILIGAPQFGHPEPGEAGVGKAYLVLGRPQYLWPASPIDLAQADASFLGCPEGDMSGRQNYMAGDVNGDGYSDFLVSGWKCNEGLLYQGKAFLFLGRAEVNWHQDFPVEQADASFLGEDAEDHASYYSASAGDVNGDGWDDMLITSTESDDGGLDAGEVYLILGRAAADWGPNYPLAQADASFVGETPGQHVGRSATGVGDVDGDGYDDFLIGSIGDEDGDTAEGESYLILGRSAADWGIHYSLANADASFVGEASGDEAGRRVAWAGDVNSDGYSDFLIGASKNADAGLKAGKSYLILGQAAPAWGKDYPLAQADASFLGEAAGDQAGRRVSGAGDVNRDGYDDLLIGAPHSNRGAEAAGAAYLLYGRAAADWGLGFLLSQADVIYVGEEAFDVAGYEVARAGDMDGDGIDDLAVGAYGQRNLAQVPGKAYVILSHVSELPGRPELVAPLDGTFTSTHTIPLTWRAGNGGRPEAFNLEIDGQVITSTRTLWLTTLPSGLHSWRVRAFNDAGYSEYCAAWGLEIMDLPGVPRLLAPPDGVITSTHQITFTWQAGSGGSATGYNLQIDADVITTTQTAASAVLSAGEHSWRVRAFNEAGTSDYSSIWGLTVKRRLYLPLIARSR